MQLYKKSKQALCYLTTLCEKTKEKRDTEGQQRETGRQTEIIGPGSSIGAANEEGPQSLRTFMKFCGVKVSKPHLLSGIIYAC